MEADHVTDLLGAHALDALDDREAVAVDEHLAVCDRCRAEAAELAEAAAALAILVPPEASAPPELRARIMSSAAGSASAAAVPLARRRLPRHTVVSIAAAVVAVVALGAQALLLFARGPETDESSRRLAEALAAPGTRVVALKPPTRVHPVGWMSLVVTPAQGPLGGEAFLVASRVAPAPDEHVYETWWIVGDQPVAGATFDARSAPVVKSLGRPVDGTTAVAVTLERGYQTQPHGTPVMQGSLPA